MNASLQPGTSFSVKSMILNLGAFRLGPLSFDLDMGDYLVLLGPSGCGKTSFLKALAGVYELPPATVLLGKDDISALPAHKRRVGYVSQTPDLFPHMNVAQNVAFGLQYLKRSTAEKNSDFERIVELLGITGLLRRFPATLSGGESKRVSLARSLVTDPRILLLDEPLSMLDHNARLRMLDMLNMVHDELGTTTVHVTHDRGEALKLGGRCAVMRDGVIEQIGSVEDLFSRPESRFTAEFLGVTP